MAGISKTLVVCLLAAIMFVTSGCDIGYSTVSLAAAPGLECQISINADGTINEINDNTERYSFDTGGWRDIKSVSASQIFIGGIKKDGTVLIDGCPDWKLDAADWRDIVMLEFSAFSAYGLKKDGTIMISSIEGTKSDDIVNEKVKSWTDIIYIDTSLLGIVGVKKDGKAVAALFNNAELEAGIGKWENIRTVSASFTRIIGLKDNGKIVEVSNDLMNFKLDYRNELKGAVKVCAGDLFVAGLMPDGTLKVVYVKDYSEEDEDYIDYRHLDNLKEVADINSYEDVLVALQKDGTVKAAGFSGD